MQELDSELGTLLARNSRSDEWKARHRTRHYERRKMPAITSYEAENLRLSEVGFALLERSSKRFQFLAAGSLK